MKSWFSQPRRAAARLPRLLFLLAILTGNATAGEGAIPPPVTAADFSQLLEHPPFRRSLSLSESMVLSGVAVLADGPMVTLLNRTTRESFVVGHQPNSQGWKLLELSQSTDLRSVTAVISAAGQELTVRFDPERLTPPKLDPPSRPGARPEGQIVVEALLRSLDPGAAKAFEALPPTGQESFRKSFAEFLEAYPGSGDSDRRSFVQRSLAETSASASEPVSPTATAPATAPRTAAPGNP